MVQDGARFNLHENPGFCLLEGKQGSFLFMSNDKFLNTHILRLLLFFPGFSLASLARDLGLVFFD